MQQCKLFKRSSSEDSLALSPTPEKMKASLMRTPIGSVIERKNNNPDGIKTPFRINDISFTVQKIGHRRRRIRGEWETVIKLFRVYNWKENNELAVKLKWSTNYTLTMLSRGIQNYFLDLQKLDITLKNSFEISDATWETFAFGVFSSLKNLRHLKMHFYRAQNTGLIAVTSALCKCLPKLDSLDLLLYWFNTQGSIENIVYNICHTFRDLKSLCLKFGRLKLAQWQIAQEDLNETVNPYLRAMHRKVIPVYRGIEAAMLNIVDIISHHLTKLVSLKFTIKGLTSIYKQGDSITKRIGTKIPSLKAFSIEFSKYINKLKLVIFATRPDLNQCYLLKDLSKISFDELPQSLKRFNLRGIQDCNARGHRFIRFQHIVAEPLQGLCEEKYYLGMLGKNMEGLLKRLEQFAFEFSGNDRMTDEGFISFISAIQFECLLKSLTLNLEKWNLSDASLEILGQKISNYLINLELLELDFTANCAITSEGVEKLIECCQTQTKLKEFTIILYWCDNVTRDDVKRFKKLLDFVPELRIFI